MADDPLMSQPLCSLFLSLPSPSQLLLSAPSYALCHGISLCVSQSSVNLSYPLDSMLLEGSTSISEVFLSWKILDK